MVRCPGHKASRMGRGEERTVSESIWAAVTKYWMASEQPTFISHSSRGQKSERRVPARSRLGENSLPGGRLLTVSSHGRRGWGALWGSLIL